ncbi:MAG: CdvA-like protein [Thaumarchaeota archaeon]|nr:CdvA-like protein [Nitrososphaerota archaeon]
MTHSDVDIIGKNVKDMYGTFMGKVVGTLTDIDGSIQSVGIDCGSQGLQQVPFEQLVVQNDLVIFIPKWRLDSQALLREKQLTLRRLKALIDIVSENNDMREDAEIIHERYKSKLASLNETEHIVKAKLEERMAELDVQAKAAKMLLFDAKVQFKSDETSEETFDTVKLCISELLEHVNHEIAEIQNVQKRIVDLDAEVEEVTAPPQPLQDSAIAYLGTSDIRSKLPEAPTEPVPSSESEPISAGVLPTVPAFGTENEDTSANPEPTKQDTVEAPKDSESNWLARMGA